MMNSVKATSNVNMDSTTWRFPHGGNLYRVSQSGLEHMVEGSLYNVMKDQTYFGKWTLKALAHFFDVNLEDTDDGDT